MLLLFERFVFFWTCNPRALHICIALKFMILIIVMDTLQKVPMKRWSKMIFITIKLQKIDFENKSLKQLLLVTWMHNQFTDTRYRACFGCKLKIVCGINVEKFHGKEIFFFSNKCQLIFQLQLVMKPIFEFFQLILYCSVDDSYFEYSEF